MEEASAWQPSVEELQQIRRESSEVVRETPVYELAGLSRQCGGKVWVKAENLQRTGSFKLRGVLSKLRASAADGQRGVVAGSAGNHGQALAYAAALSGLSCTVFMPKLAAVSKVDAVRALGAEVRQEGASVDDCVAAAQRLSEEEGTLFVHPFDDLDVVKGQAGLGLELADQVPDLARVIVPVGGGGLIGGVAAALKPFRPEVEVVGVQASGCAPFPDSLAQGKPLPASESSTIADGIAVKRPGEITLGLAERWVDQLVVVDDDEIAEAMVSMVETAKLVVEGAGAVAVAALASGTVGAAGAGATVAVLSGGNVDAHVLAAVINRHQTGIGRRGRLFTRVSDRPGGLAGLLQTVAEGGANVLDVTHVRDGVALHVEETGVEILVETRSQADHAELVDLLRHSGYEVDELR
jgi:threonine dehydratase